MTDGSGARQPAGHGLLSPDSGGLTRAAEALRAGALVAFPTETVYGLGADATAGEAVAGIFAAKDRPRFNPLIAHVATVEAALQLGQFPPAAQRLARAFWPGPLTLVVPRAPDSRVSALATAGLDTVALRVPGHPVAQALLAAVGRPVAAPSANRSGRLSPTRADHVAADLGSRVAAVLDGGACPVGVESTILAVTDGQVTVLRPGGLSLEAIRAAAGVAPELPAAPAGAEQPASPGQLTRHYAPGVPLRCDARAPEPGEAFLGFGAVMPDAPAGPAENLSPAGDTHEAAARLFAALHRLAAARPAGIAVAPIPRHGLGLAINDRLRRAAAGTAVAARETEDQP